MRRCYGICVLMKRLILIGVSICCCSFRSWKSSRDNFLLASRYNVFEITFILMCVFVLLVTDSLYCWYMQTIAVVPVLPHGVLQFGSCLHVSPFFFPIFKSYVVKNRLQILWHLSDIFKCCIQKKKKRKNGLWLKRLGEGYGICKTVLTWLSVSMTRFSNMYVIFLCLYKLTISLLYSIFSFFWKEKLYFHHCCL